MSAEEKRRHRRRQLSGIEGTLRSPRDVKVVDLSLTGMAIETAHTLTVGERYFLELNHRRHTASVEVEIQWCSKVRMEAGEDGRPRPVYRAGASFVDIYRDEAGGIWDWIEADADSERMA